VVEVPGVTAGGVLMDRCTATGAVRTPGVPVRGGGSWGESHTCDIRFADVGVVQSGGESVEPADMLGDRRRLERASRSRGVWTSIWPISVVTIFGQEPLRLFPDPCPAGSYDS
jgi:hypothetical protein